VRRLSLAVLLLVSSLTAPDEGETLLPGPPLARPIAAGEKHVYRLAVTETPVLVTVEQQSIDLVVEVRGPAGEELRVDAGGSRWGPEVMLLASAGERRIEVRPKEKSAWPGRYTIGVESVERGSARQQALAVTSRAGQEVFAKTSESRRQAAASYREAAAAWHALGDRRREAEVLSNLAQIEQEAGDLRPAVEDHERALALWREVGEPRREAATLNELGVTRLGIGEHGGAREAFERALSLWKEAGERFDGAETQSSLCFLEQRLGDLRKALACYGEPLAVFREAGDQDSEKRLLNNLGGIYDLLGEPDAALDHYQQALTLCRALGDRTEEARALNNIGVIHRTLGEWQEALRLYGQAREILDRTGDRALKAAVLTNIGSAYNSLGEPERALAFLEKALALRREIGDRQGETIILNVLGQASRRLGDPGKALDQQRQALKLAGDLSDARQMAFIRTGLADVLIEQGDPGAALREVDAALAYLKESGPRTAETQALLLEGRALALAGRPSQALPILEEVVTRQQELRNRAGEAGALHALALAERSLGHPAEALAHAKAAIARVEELRTGFVSPELRAAFLATQHRAYSLLIDLLMSRHAADPGGGWDRAALAASEQVNARNLLDALHAGNAGHGAGAVSVELRERRQSLRRRLSAKADQQVKQKGARAEALGQEIEALLADLDRVDAEIAHADPQAGALRRAQPLGLQEIAGLLDPGTLLLEYALGEERSFLWAVDAQGELHSFILPPRREIEALARRVYEELSTVEAGAPRRGEAAEALGKILLGPVWSTAARADRLAIVPDGALHAVPFGALPAPDPHREPLLEHAEVVYLPSATTLALERQRLGDRPPAPKQAAVFGDPVFAASQPGEEAGLLPALERLPGSRREAEAIARLAPPGQVWTALGLAANRETVLSGELHAYRTLHFATHGIANTRNPEMSGLVLSQVDAAGQPREGFLSLADVYDLDLGADLVVLSGCRTALGKEVRGEGLMGITRGFLYAGVPRVVASLWAVQDNTGTELMIRFYQAMWQKGLPPAAALRQAQRSLRHDPRYRTAYSWAGFVLQGDWR